jgi:hypothetical protein
MMVTLAFVTILLRRHWRFKTRSQRDPEL